jgi:hypothetical protein
MMVDRSTDASRLGTRLAPSHLIGGIGGLVFVASAIIQNLIRAKLPANDARIGRIIDYYRGHRGATSVLAVLFVIGAAGIATFAGGLLARLRADHVRGPAIAGALGLAGIFSLFTMTVAADLALSGYVHRGHPATASVSLLWTLHNATFGVLLVAVGVALAGLSAAAAGQGIIGAYWKPIGLLGAITLGVAGAATPALIDGSPVLAIGLVGFIAWLAFVTTTSVALLRAGKR